MGIDKSRFLEPHIHVNLGANNRCRKFTEMKKKTQYIEARNHPKPTPKRGSGTDLQEKPAAANVPFAY